MLIGTASDPLHGRNTLSRSLDLYLYDKVFSPFSEWLHKRFGFGSLVIAKWLIWLGIAFMLAAFCTVVAAPWSQVPSSEVTHMALLGVLLLIEAALAYRILRKTLELEEKSANRSSTELAFRDFRDGPYPEVALRRFFLFILVLLCLTVPLMLFQPEHRYLILPEVLRVLSMAVVLVGCYFMAVPPRMPRKREKRAHVPEGVLAPART